MFNPTFASKNREVGRATLLQAPALEPVTLSEAKKQCEIAESDTAHDDKLTLLMQAAREQWENDTDTAVMEQTLTMTLPYFPLEIHLQKRPVQSVVSITYYDTRDILATVPTEIYSLDIPNRIIRENYLKDWPMTIDRWDAVTVTYIAGYELVANVPAIAKQAMLLLVSHYFENPDMMMSEAMMSVATYEHLVRRFMRSTYP
jgi:uncharacterized phiE125 gp8 family phage protein